MRAYKEGRFLVFELSEGRNVKYDLSDGSYIGLSGKKVKKVNEQLKGYNVYGVIQSFEDENYKKFLNKVYDSISTGVENTGTFLKYVRQYRHLEQYFACGIENVSICIPHISEVPSGLIDYAKTDNKIKINRQLINEYKKHPDQFMKVFNYNFKAIKKESFVSLLCDNWSSATDSLKRLTSNYNYDFDRLMKYLDDIVYYEGIRNFKCLLNELYDYAKMSKAISKDGKFNKYPVNFLTTHTITVRNYNRLNKLFNESEFEERINLDLEYKYKDYVFIYPKSTKDIKQEAVSLTHCVASYIDEVIKGNCHIIFLRHKDKQDESLVTLEIRGNEVTQAKGMYNRDVNKSEAKAIEAYNKYLSKLGGK